MSDLDLYDRTAERSAAVVIRRYSTSFSLASRLFGPRVRAHVTNVYALVRVADEIVDGPGTDAGLSLAQTRATLDRLEGDTLEAMDTGFSANLVIHAFARTARHTGITADLVTPFFASMRADIDTTAHDPASHDTYVYGSAEVVGLMCLQVFHNAGRTTPGPPPSHLVDAARRLGAAFQDVNFLRDQGEDENRLGRDYLGIGVHASREEILDRIDNDLAVSRAALRDLPSDSRRAVAAAHALFAELNKRLRDHPEATGRVRVPTLKKISLVARSALLPVPTPPPMQTSS